MSGIPPTQADRNANLQALLNSVQQWGQSEQTRINNETKFLRAIQQSHNASATGTANLATASALLESSINDFINF